MNTKRIKCAIFLSLIFTTLIPGTCVSANVNQADSYNPEKEILEIMDEERSLYLTDLEFYREAASKGLSFEELLHQKATTTYQNRVKMRTIASVYDLGNNGNNLYTTIPLIKQTSNYNCGPTSALQALYGMKRQSSVQGNTDAEKIATLMNECGTDKTGTMVYKMVEVLNNHSDLFDYKYTKGTSMTETEFQGKVETSLFYNMAPILHARTEYLTSYYKGHRSGHYIAICEVDKVNKTIRVKDCNNNEEYYGEHVVSVTEAYQSITGSKEYERYLIHMSY